MNLPSTPDPYQILNGSQTPNAFYLCLTDTDTEELNYVTLPELHEVDTSKYQRLPIVFDINAASDNTSLVATCDTTLDTNGEPQYLDFFCGDDGTDVAITGAYVIASFDDHDYLIYIQPYETPVEWFGADDSARVQQITISATTWVAA